MPDECTATVNIHGFPLVEFFVCGVTDVEGEDLHVDLQGWQRIAGERRDAIRRDCRKDPALCLHHVQITEFPKP